MDKIKIEPLERLEIEDARALSDLPYEHMRRMLGQILGAGDVATSAKGGCLSHPVPVHDAVANTLTFSAFAYLELNAGGAPLLSGAIKTPEARVVRFDSSQNHINHPIDVSTLWSTGFTYRCFARWYLIDSDTDTRRKWDLTTSAEVSYSPQTRRRERVEFQITKGGSPTDQAGYGQWTEIFTYTVDGAGAPTFSYIRAMDAMDPKALARLTTPSIDALERFASPLDETAIDNSHAGGILETLSLLKGQVYRIIQKGVFDASPADAGSWLRSPDASLKDIYLRTVANASDIIPLQTTTNTLNKIKNVCVEFDFEYEIATTTGTWKRRSSDNDFVGGVDFQGLATSALNSIADVMHIASQPIIFATNNDYASAKILNVSAVPRFYVTSATHDSMSDLTNPSQPDYYARADAGFGPFGLRQSAQLYDDPALGELFSQLRTISVFDGSQAVSHNNALSLIGVIPALLAVGGFYRFGYSVYITLEKT